MLRSPVIMNPVGLYMNGELAEVQSEGLDLKSTVSEGEHNICPFIKRIEEKSI